MSEDFDVSAYLATFSNAELIAATKEAKSDLEKASRDQPDSEWHSSCFAGLLVYAREMSERGLTMASIH